MTTYEFDRHVQRLLDATSTDLYSTKYLLILARGYEHIAEDLSEVIYAKNRTFFSKTQVLSQERFRDLRKQAEAFPLGQVFHELIALKKAIAALIDAFSEGEHTFLRDLEHQVNTFYEALEVYVRTNKERAFSLLINEATQLYTTVSSARRVLVMLKEALVLPVPDPDEGWRSLSMSYYTEQAMRHVYDKLRALEQAYNKLCELARVSREAYPLTIVKIETGSLWICVRGEARMMSVLKALVERYALFLYHRFSAEDGAYSMADRVTATQSLVNLADELERIGLSDVATDEARLRKSALVLREALTTLLAGEHTIRVDETELAVQEAAREWYVAESRKLMREQPALVAANGHAS